MNSYLILSFFCLIILSATRVKGDCDDEVKEDDGNFKKLLCQVKKGAEDAYHTVKKGAEDGYEAVKPFGDKIATSAKEFGSTVAKKYDEVKHKLTDDNVPTDNKVEGPVSNEPTEKVFLAPLSAYSPTKSEPRPSRDEQKTSRMLEPEGFGYRFLLQNINPCPPGQALDHTKKNCRQPV